MVGGIPPATLEEEAVDVATVLWFLLDVGGLV